MMTILDSIPESTISRMSHAEEVSSTSVTNTVEPLSFGKREEWRTSRSFVMDCLYL